VQEKQQGDGDIGEMIHNHGCRAAAWQQARQDKRPYQREDEVVGQELRPGHACALLGVRSDNRKPAALAPEGISNPNARQVRHEGVSLQTQREDFRGAGNMPQWEQLIHSS